MISSFRTCVLSLARDKSLLVWTLAFPIIMSSIFMAMFSNLDEHYAPEACALGVVGDANYDDAYGLDETLAAISDSSAEDQLATTVTFDSETEAIQAANAGDIDAYLTVDEAGTPQLHVASRMNGQLSPEIIRTVLDSYLHTREAYETVATKNAALLANGDVLAAFRSDAVQTVRLQATKSSPDPDVRYYFSLLAMTAGMGSMLVGYAIRGVQPKGSAVGARRSLAGTARWRVLLGTILGAWACQFVCMLTAMAFMWAVVGVNFGDSPLLVVVAVLVSSLMACAAGSFFGGGTGFEPGMVSGVTCLLSLFTGLYGTAAQRLADGLEAAVPALVHANPLWQMSNCFYSLLYYDTLGPFLTSCLTLLAMAAAFFALAALHMRRLSYDQL